MRFEEAYYGWQERRLNQSEAARLSGVCERTDRCTIGRYEENGLEGLADKRLVQVSHRRAPVDKRELTQFGGARHQLGIEMIAAYSPQARGRSERVFQRHQDRSVKELAPAGITEKEAANGYIQLPIQGAGFSQLEFSDHAVP